MAETRDTITYDVGEYLRILNEELDYVYPKSVSLKLLDSDQLQARASFVIDFDVEQLDRNAAKKFPFASSELFGPQDAQSVCKICSGIDCVGHPGIMLFPTDASGKRVMITNPSYVKDIRSIMNVICHECNNVLVDVAIPYEKREMDKIRGAPKAQKLAKLLSLIGLGGNKKITYAECTKPTTTKKGIKVYCSTKHKLMAAGDNKSKIVFEKKTARAPKKRAKRSKAKRPALLDDSDDSQEETEIEDDETSDTPRSSISKPDIFLPRDAYEMLMKIPEDQLENYIGRTKQEISAYFKTSMWILESKFRSSISKDKPDKLTTCLINIEKICRDTNRESTELIVKLTDEVTKYELLTDDINKAKRGHFRSKMAGKRARNNCRAVIVPTAGLRINQITIPRRLARTSLFQAPRLVTESNIYALQSELFDGMIGVINKASGGGNPWQPIQVGLDNYSDKSSHILQIGDLVSQHSKDGDFLIHGRQPTLSRTNIVGAEIKISDKYTIGVSTNAADLYHGDFDGDSMWAAALQTLEALGEAKTLININNVIRNYQKNTAAIGIVYNGILASSLLTITLKNPTNGYLGPVVISPELYKIATFSFAQHPRMKTLGARLAKKGVEMYTGAGLFSALLPENFYYKGGKKSGNRYVIIEDGILVQGMISKSTVGSNSTNTIVDRLAMFYKTHMPAVDFINDANSALFVFLDSYGFTISHNDCYLGNYEVVNGERIDVSFNKEMSRLLASAEDRILSMKVLEGRSATEKEISTMLIEFDVAGESYFQATQNLDNALLFMSEHGSGAKGKEGNLRTIGVTVGQQKINGERFPRTLSDNTRCLYTDRPYDISLKAQGFIVNSYTSGLTPRENFFAAAGNRAGLIQNALTTHDVGKVQRYLQVAMGDITTKNGSAVFHNKIVLEWCYGGDSSSGLFLEKVDDVYQSSNLDSIIDLINADES